MIGGAWAVMDEWGTGSKMDLNNPFLDQYRNSDLWNPARKDTAIRTRPQGEYTDIFGEKRYAKGNNPGFNLERTDYPITLTEPSHAMSQAIAWLKGHDFQLILQRILQEIDLGAFLEVEVRGYVRS